MQSDGDTPNLSETQYTAVQDCTAPLLRIGETVVVARALEARIAWCLTSLDPAEEGLEGLIQATQYVLQDLRVDLSIVGTGSFQVWQFHGLLVVRGALALATLPPGLALLERDSIEHPAALQD